MATSASERRARGSVPLPTVPALKAGDQLTRDEFERRYAAMTGLKKAELVEEVVYMPSPVRVRRRGSPHANIVGWLIHYQARTPGVEVADNATVRVDMDNEPQPDAMLFIAPELGGQVRIRPDDYVEAAPELLVPHKPLDLLVLQRSNVELDELRPLRHAFAEIALEAAGHEEPVVGARIQRLAHPPRDLFPRVGIDDFIQSVQHPQQGAAAAVPQIWAGRA
jgi:hypothetical protein